LLLLLLLQGAKYKKGAYLYDIVMQVPDRF